MLPLTEDVRTPVRVVTSVDHTAPRSKPAKEKVFFPNLDGLRFFCFLSVFLLHCFNTNHKEIITHPVYLLTREIFIANGSIGVNFFFVLSGFLITYLLIVEKNTYGKIHVHKFWVRRILRIWPLYFACITFGFAIFPVIRLLAGHQPQENASLLYYLTFLSNFDVVAKGYWPESRTLGVLWSVAIEEQFYFLWPMLMVFFNKKWLPALFALIIGGSLVFRALNDNFFMHEHHSLSCMGDMAIGGLGAFLVQNARFKAWIAERKAWHIGAVYLLFAIIYFFRHPIFLTTYPVRIFERSFIAFVILAIILEQNYAKNSLFKMSRFKTISRLGTLTYGMYCLHFLAILIITNLTIRYHFNTEVWQVLILEPLASLALTIVISKLSYRYFERWFLRLKEKFSYISR